MVPPAPERFLLPNGRYSNNRITLGKGIVGHRAPTSNAVMEFQGNNNSRRIECSNGSRRMQVKRSQYLGDAPIPQCRITTNIKHLLQPTNSTLHVPGVMFRANEKHKTRPPAHHRINNNRSRRSSITVITHESSALSIVPGIAINMQFS
jgi:hypothetical protein